MENQPKNIFEFNFNEEIKTNFSSIAQWLLIGAVVGFTSLAVSVISMFKVISMAYTGGIVFAVVISTIIVVAISLLLNITLLTAANNLKKGLTLTDQGHFNTGLQKLAAYYRIIGILFIIALVVFALVMVVAIIGGTMGGFK